MTVAKFKKQIKYLSEHDYYFPTWDEVYAFQQGKIDLPKKSVVVTIDDGAKSFYAYAVPILKKYKVRATGFIISKNIQKKTVEKYNSDLITLQSHTNDMHRAGRDGRGYFVTAGYKYALRDLTKSTKKLKNNDALAYPYGHYNAFTRRVVRASGIKMAFTTKAGRVYPGMSRTALPRVRISAGISLNAYIASIK
jgi:peptidoglycan/xylan/chitin deacetylase (PgdA/CDA1 family)